MKISPGKVGLSRTVRVRDRDRARTRVSLGLGLEFRVRVAMMGTVGRGCLYEITNLVHFNFTRVHISLDRALQLSSY